MQPIFLSSSAAEHPAVNRQVVSSILTWGANQSQSNRLAFFVFTGKTRANFSLLSSQYKYSYPNPATTCLVFASLFLFNFTNKNTTQKNKKSLCNFLWFICFIKKLWYNLMKEYFYELFVFWYRMLWWV